MAVVSARCADVASDAVWTGPREMVRYTDDLYFQYPLCNHRCVMLRIAPLFGRAVSNRNRCAALFAMVVLLSPLPVVGAQLFSLSQTGAQLAVNPGVTFHETGVVAGSSLDFTGGAGSSFLFSLPMLPAAPRSELTVTIGIDFTPLSGDNDFIFGLHDGTRIAGWERSDNSSGSWFVREGALNGIQVPGFSAVQGGLGAVEPFTMVYVLPDGGGDTAFSITEGGDSTSFTFSANALDGDAPLTFFMAREGGAEGYRINLVTISVVDGTPVVTSVTPIDSLSIAGRDFVSSDTRLRASAATISPTLMRRGLQTQLSMIDVRRIARLQRPASALASGGGLAAVAGEEVGLSAGDGQERPWSLWADASLSSTRDDFAATAFSGHVQTLLVGADILWDERLLIGGAVGYEQQDISTGFNAGQQEVDQYLATLYGAYLFGERVSVDAAIGHARMDIAQFRTQPLFGRVDSDLRGRRWFAAANVNLHSAIGALLVDVSTGVLLARDRHEAFNESNGLANPAQNFTLGQWRIGAGFAYPVSGFELFGSGYYVHDFEREPVRVARGQPQPDNDRGEFQVGAGLRYVGGNGISASLEYQTVLGRSNLDSDRVGLNIRVPF